MSLRQAIAPPEQVAALVAPILDRLRVSIAHAVVARSAEAAARAGASEPALLVLAMVRNTMPDRPFSREQLGRVLRYTPPERVDAGVDGALAAGLLTGPPHELRLGDAGRDLLEAVYAATSEVVAERWAGHGERVERLAAITGRALEAATASGGAAFAILAPPYEPPGAPPAVVLAERLTPLRYHRFDAHVAAWETAGLTVDQIQALGPGPERDAIEAETNRRAAAPYAALSPHERLELLGGLGALPN